MGYSNEWKEDFESVTENLSDDMTPEEIYDSMKGLGIEKVKAYLRRLISSGGTPVTDPCIDTSTYTEVDILHKILKYEQTQ